MITEAQNDCVLHKTSIMAFHLIFFDKNLSLLEKQIFTGGRLNNSTHQLLLIMGTAASHLAVARWSSSGVFSRGAATQPHGTISLIKQIY